ncbi:MAG: hypothetical protein K8R90_11855 [Candidatus Cloacimonetes bacterium]|nr:hypothetical protein [Candidatus Cloacimonadota bacterium]
MYSKQPSLVLGFHGCDRSIRDKVVSQRGILLNPSENKYDWLGSGVYFWENNYQRAIDFATFLYEYKPHNLKQTINEPSVIGAIIDLGFCLNLLDTEYLNLLKVGYDSLLKFHTDYNLPIPKNVPLVENGDLLKRNLDCAVIETIHTFNKDKGKQEFDSIRGVFIEGNDLYPNAGFKEKNHIQIAVRNPNCIKGYFIPRDIDPRYNKP